MTALEAVRERLARSLVLSWPRAPQRRLLESLQALLQQHRGGQCAVLLRYSCKAASGTLAFGADWKVRPTHELLERLESLLGAGQTQLR